jgi:hypothetical protein
MMLMVLMLCFLLSVMQIPYAEFHTEFHAECRYAEWRGAKVTDVKSFMIEPWAFGQIHPNPKSCIYASQWMRGFRLGLLS